VFVLPALTTLISLGFAVQVLNQYRERGKTHQLAWGVALVLWAVASVPEAVASINGWDALGYRVFYLFGGVLLVPWLALGTAELLLRGDRAHGALIGYRVFVGVITLVGLVAVLAAPLHTSHLATTEAPSNCTMFCSTEHGYNLFNVISLVEAIVGNTVGVVVLAVGALYSAIRSFRAGLPLSLPAGNVLILVGSLVVALAATLTRFGSYEYFYAGQAAGIAIIFAGFLVIARTSFQARPQPA
jgi:hypothetical protein